MSIARHALRFVTILVAMFPAAAHAAKIDPPTIALGRSTASLVVAEYKEAGPGGRLVFEKLRTLRSPSEVPQLIDIGTPDLIEPLHVGARYVLAYTMYKNDPLKRTVTNIKGAVFLATPGLEPALWKASPQIEELVTWSIGDDIGQARAALPRLLGLLRSRDAQLQNFSAAELTFRPALLRTLDAAEQRQLRSFVGDAHAPPVARARLLLAALDMPSHGRSRQAWQREAERVLRDESVLIRARPGHSELVLDAFRHLETREVAVRPASLQRWLASDEIALAETALLALRRQSPDAEQAALAQAIERRDVPAATRQFLLDHQHRLRRQLTAP